MKEVNSKRNDVRVRYGADGIHFFNRRTGVNILLDECRPPAELWAKGPRQVSIALTNLCNLSCPHCYAPKFKASLDTHMVKVWLKELDEASCFGVGFGGGEPTLHKDLVEICRYGANNTGLAITMTTHGHNLNQELIAALKGNIHFLRLSMDGIYSTYEKIRGRSFKDFLSKTELLQGNIPYGINYVVNANTVHELTEAADIIEKIGAVELLLLPEEGVGRGRSIDTRSLQELQRWLVHYEGPLRLTTSSSYRIQLNATKPLQNEDIKTAFVHIDARGILKKSSFARSGVTIGESGVINAYQTLMEL